MTQRDKNKKSALFAKQWGNDIDSASAALDLGTVIQIVPIGPWQNT
jgi:hypothetical protein